jgi:rhodanese-related sulfurtransferase
VEIITARELKDRMDRAEPLQIIDIREPHERVIAKFPNAKPIPLGQMARKVDASPPVDSCRGGLIPKNPPSGGGAWQPKRVAGAVIKY